MENKEPTEDTQKGDLFEEIKLSEDITWKIHHNFLFYHYNFLPQPYQSQDSNRVTLAYFVFGAMDLLNIIDHPKLNKQHVIDWIYSLQILPGKDREINKHNLGFRGSNFFVTPHDSSCEVFFLFVCFNLNHSLGSAHLISTIRATLQCLLLQSVSC